MASVSPGSMVSDGEIACLKAEHGQLEKRLAELESHLSLTPVEQVERAALKKQKLRIKDRLSLLGG